MFKLGRNALLLGTLGAGVVVPYVSTEADGLKQSLSSLWESGSNASSAGGEPWDVSDVQYVVGPDGKQYPSIYQSPPGLSGNGPTGKMDLAVEGPPVMDFAEVFRFDVAMDWLISRWPRVSTQLTEHDLQAYRVPLVTGVREDDLAGSLTYYFDKQQVVRRITFEGVTGDATRLVQLVTQKFELSRQSDNDPGLFAYRDRWNNDVISELRVRPAPVVRADDPHRRFRVSMELGNPPSTFSRPGVFKR